MSRSARDADDLSLAECACLGILYPSPSHGFAISARLQPTGDFGRVWSVTRPLTYRALEHLHDHGYIKQIGQEVGVAGGNRQMLSISKNGRAFVRQWVRCPVSHLRDLRSELLLKLMIGEQCNIDLTDMVRQQRKIVKNIIDSLAQQKNATDDVITLWRCEIAEASRRFLDAI